MSKRKVAIIVVAMLVGWIGTALAYISVNNRNIEVAGCREATLWWNTRGHFQDQAFNIVHDRSISERVQQQHALTVVESLVAWESEVKPPDFAQPLADAAIVEDQNWANTLLIALGGDGVQALSTDEHIDSMRASSDAFKDVQAVCEWSDASAPVDIDSAGTE